MYHAFSPTASDFAITEWNIDKDSLPAYYVEETVDLKGRVKELEFFEDGISNFEHLCYLSTWIKYDYPDERTVVVSFLNESGKPEANLECETPSKAIYYLSDDKTSIIRTEYLYEIDRKHYLAIGWSNDFIDEVLADLQSHSKNALVIDSYSKSLAKLKGIFPVSPKFNLGTIYFNDIEKEKIKTVGNHKN